MFRKAIILTAMACAFWVCSAQAKQGDPNCFDGEYWFGSLSADANSWEP